RPSLDFYSDCKVIPTSLADLQDKFVHKSYLLVDNDSLQKINLKDSKTIGTVKEFTLVAPFTKL
ncbi:MAG: phospholipid carrier-dependent glycosyltransferase, partial [Dolichospermum sp.]